MEAPKMNITILIIDSKETAGRHLIKFNSVQKCRPIKSVYSFKDQNYELVIVCQEK